MNDQAIAKPEGFWTVFDKNATRLDKDGNMLGRTHEVAPGRRYTLHFDKPTHMPEAMARVFLKDEAFVVQDAEGNDVLPLSIQAQQRYVPQRLAPNFVIASLEELTSEALVTRAAQFRGADRFTADTDRSILIRFLTQAQRAVDAANTVSEDADDARNRGAVPAPVVEVEEGMSEAELSRAFS